LFLLIASFSSGNAIVTAAVTAVQNFSRRPSVLIVVLVIGYYKFDNMLEYTVRLVIFEEVDVLIYYPCLGAFLAIVYIIGALLIRKVHLDERYEKVLITSDKIGIYIYLLIAAIMSIVVYIFSIVIDKWFTSAMIIIGFGLFNFVVIALVAQIAISKLQNMSSASGHFSKSNYPNRHFDDCVTKPQFISLFISSMLVVGS